MHKTAENPKFGDVKCAFYYASISFTVFYPSLYYALHETMKTVYNYRVKHVPCKDLFFFSSIKVDIVQDIDEWQVHVSSVFLLAENVVVLTEQNRQLNRFHIGAINVNSIYTTKPANARMWIVLITCYSFPICFNNCHSHHQGTKIHTYINTHL